MATESLPEVFTWNQLKTINFNSVPFKLPMQWVEHASAVNKRFNEQRHVFVIASRVRYRTVAKVMALRESQLKRPWEDTGERRRKKRGKP